MKKIAVLLFVFFVFHSNSLVQAVTSEDYAVVNQTVVSLPVGEIVNRDYFAAGEIVEISGTVNGDAFVAGGQVIVSGTINGDLLVVGGKVTINGEVKEDVRALGGQLIISGAIGKNLSTLGGDIELSKDAIIGGNVTIGGGSVNLAARIPGDLKIGAGNITLNNRIEGDVLAGFSKMLVTSTGLISGDMIYWSKLPQDFSLTNPATVSGQIVYRHTPSYLQKWENPVSQQSLENSVRTSLNAFRLVSLFGTLLVGYLMIHFFPNLSAAAIHTIENQPLANSFVGLAALILTPFVSVFLFFSLIGIPMAFIILLLYGLFLYLARIIFAYWLGARILSRLAREATKNITFLIGLGLYYILTSIAFVGPLVTFIGSVLGLGALLTVNKYFYLSTRRSRLL